MLCATPSFVLRHRPLTELELTAVVEAVELEQVVIAELHALADNVHELWDLGDDGGRLGHVERRLAVVHHRAVVVGHAQGTGRLVVVLVEVVVLACEGTFMVCMLNGDGDVRIERNRIG